MSARKLVTKAILEAAQEVANEVDHEDHDEAVRVALDVAAPLIEAKLLSEERARLSSQVLGRVHWGPKNCTNWTLFPNITAYRTWAAAMRKARPEVKCEYAMLSIPGAAHLLGSAQAEQGYRAKQLEALL